MLALTSWMSTLTLPVGPRLDAATRLADPSPSEAELDWMRRS